MNFKTYIDTAWMKHDKSTTEVVSSYPEGIELSKTEDDVLAIARLVSHVATEHNFSFEIAISTIEKLLVLSHVNSPQAKATLGRILVTLKFTSGQAVDVSKLTVSDRTIVFITAAASNLLQNHFEKTVSLLNNAIAASHSLSDLKDPAYRTLAMLTNNMAATLGDRTQLNEVEKELLIELAQYARTFWEKAGTWLQVERAEYYLSKYFRKIQNYQKSEHHALLCLHICEKENAEPLEYFFAHEALALTFRESGSELQYQRHLEMMKKYFEKCQASDQSWMQDSLDKADKS